MYQSAHRSPIWKCPVCLPGLALHALAFAALITCAAIIIARCF